MENICHCLEKKFLLFVFAEAVTPAVFNVQKQFNYTHILAGATAFGKVGNVLIVKQGFSVFFPFLHF